MYNQQNDPGLAKNVNRFYGEETPPDSAYERNARRFHGCDTPAG